MTHPLALEKYYFTFGCGQALAHNYVVVEAPNEEEARLKMVRTYGQKWAFSYPEKEFLPSIVRRGLTKVPFGTPNEFGIERSS